MGNMSDKKKPMKHPPVMGQYIPAPRPTWQAALLVALALSVPVFLALSFLERVM